MPSLHRLPCVQQAAQRPKTAVSVQVAAKKTALGEQRFSRSKFDLAKRLIASTIQVICVGIKISTRAPAERTYCLGIQGQGPK
jgi:hypothetical protein